MNEITCYVLETLNACLERELMVDVEGLTDREEELLRIVKHQIERVQQEYQERKTKN